MTVDESTQVLEEVDSLEEPAQEPGAPEAEPSPEIEDGAAPDEPAAADSPAAGQPEPDDAAPADAGKAEPVEPSQPDAETPPPFSFRIDGRLVELDGAAEADGRITIPREQWDRIVQPRLMDRGTVQRREERFEARIRELEEGQSDEAARAKLVLQRVDELLSDPNKLKAFADNYQVQAPRLKLEIENELLRSQTQRHETRAQRVTEERDAEVFEQNARPTLLRAAQVVLDEQDGEYGINAQQLADELWEHHNLHVPIFFRVKEGDESGLDPREHDWGVNLELVRRLLKPSLALHQKREAVKKAEAVEAKNRQAVGNKPPPTATAKGSPAGEVESEVSTREEFRQRMSQKYPWLPQGSSM